MIRPTSLFLSLLCWGCAQSGPTLHPVSGTVTYKGKPAAGATVVFHPKGDPAKPRAAGITDAAGAFQLSSPTGQGAEAGDYDVTVVMEIAAKDAKNTEGDAMADALAGKYANAANSGLKATVAAGENRLAPFDLK